MYLIEKVTSKWWTRIAPSDKRVAETQILLVKSLSRVYETIKLFDFNLQSFRGIFHLVILPVFECRICYSCDVCRSIKNVDKFGRSEVLRHHAITYRETVSISRFPKFSMLDWTTSVIAVSGSSGVEIVSTNSSFWFLNTSIFRQCFIDPLNSTLCFRTHNLQEACGNENRFPSGSHFNDCRMNNFFNTLEKFKCPETSEIIARISRESSPLIDIVI